MESATIDNKLNKKNTIIVFSIYFFVIVFTIFYILWIYYGSQAYQCTVTDNPYCQRLKCDKYDISNEINGLISQPDPQNQYVTSLFFTISMQSESSDPKINGYPFGYCTSKECADAGVGYAGSGSNCIVNVNCYDANQPLPLSNDIKNSENGPFKQLTVNVIHNNLFKEAKNMCSKIVSQNEIDLDLKNICINEFGENMDKPINTLSFLNKKMIENLAIITNFNYYTFNTETLDFTDDSNLLVTTTNNKIIKYKSCSVVKCGDMYQKQFNNGDEIFYGSSNTVLKSTDNCSKCDDESINKLYQYKLYLDNQTIDNTNVIPYFLYPISEKINQLKFL